MIEDGWEFDFVKMRFHKEEQLDVGTEACLVKHCGSTRPAYVLAATREGKRSDLMYVYQPMGLRHQYEEQGSILARFHNWNLALCFLQAASRALDIKYVKAACTVPGEDDEQNAAKQEQMLNNWHKSIDKYTIEKANLSLLDDNPDFPFDLPEVDSWSGLMGMLGLIDRNLLDEYMEWMLQKDETASP